MRFLRPDLAWWFVGALLVVVLVRWRVRRRLAVAVTTPWIFSRRYRASPFRRLPTLLLVISLALIGIALLDPVLPYAESRIHSQGLDIAIALDLSSSMQEPMSKTTWATGATGVTGPKPVPTRLEATKAAIKTFVQLRHDDRLGLVVFSDHAYVISPLTFDHDYLLRYIDTVDDQMLRGEGMTAIGDGLALSDFLLARQSTSQGHRNQVVVIFTDGENNIGRDPRDVLREADAAHVRVHMVGLAFEAEVKKKPEVQQLVRAVRQQGGRYFTADTADELTAASRAIDNVEKGVLISQTYQHDAPVYQWFAVPALVCLVLAMILRVLPIFLDQT
jgi:Ca-activated chloride channel family protein